VLVEEEGSCRSPPCGAAHLHNGRQDEHPGLQGQCNSLSCSDLVSDPDAGECVNWVSKSGTGKCPWTGWNGLLRKEVIQPHLPVRLPCYDFTPIANPTFGSSVPEGFGH
jgi:hypothetical protein